ncbi:TPA: MarR family transcriptional regulator [Staphylococcus aureus]|uniref:MarR family winged helix-turn-helix transcriptional regulator n=1 Tax=Staphylococcus aureus TaxID=1280 RepID=UPI000B7CEA6D|nr:MarR family transcriptional regulator [Staphylococcus aureus]MBY0864649.1 MarR family transcriptional regulator [Staphylococcus aureus]OXL88763.1 transcriptional regulator [Staphylococcus aureus]HCU9055684.1 MarR family transcriptional regulator [Staphylococcus aureus]HDF6356404.1 MarR family transcriptional regulator [Staphylococcus aureus]HDH2455442.1 MarR family transcriptional regulator [Staphylococcus aureus]
MDNRRFEQYNEMHLAFIEMSRGINEVMERQGIDISREQMGVFKLLFENKKLTLKEIAEMQGVFKTAISKRIKKMEEKGYVKKISSNDKREKLVVLTEFGITFYKNRQLLLYKGLEEKLNLSATEIDKLMMHIIDIKNILIKDLSK